MSETPKPGVKTSEFWLAIVVTVCAAVATVFEDNPWARIAGIVSATLVTAGYGISRAMVKKPKDR